MINCWLIFLQLFPVGLFPQINLIFVNCSGSTLTNSNSIIQSNAPYLYYCVKPLSQNMQRSLTVSVMTTCSKYNRAAAN